MGKSEFWIYEIVRAKKHACFVFTVDAKKHKGFRITFDANVSETGKDVRYVLMSHSDYQKWENWKTNPITYKRDAKGNIVKNGEGIPITVPVPEPKTAKIIDRRTNILEKTIPIKEGSYALILDNTYSTITDKTLWLHVIEEWNTELPANNLPVVNQLVPDLPKDVGICLTKANECYISGHYEQASVMLRKAVEIASRIKLLQAELGDKGLYDSEGNELLLTGKIKMLRANNLITQRAARDLDEIKWFGDVGAHGTMKIVQKDIRDNIEPRVRSYLAGLNLKL